MVAKRGSCRPCGLSASFTRPDEPRQPTVTPSYTTLRALPPRRLLAVAAALALTGAPVEAQTLAPAPAQAPAAATPAGADTVSSCPLGVFHCPPRPESFVLCRPNALLDFYDPTLPRDATLRETSDTVVDAAH